MILKKIPKYIVLPIGLLASLFLWAFDFLTGYEISFSIFYLIPITFVTVYSGLTFGLVTSILCAILWVVADIGLNVHHYSHWLIPYWNGFVRLGYFSLHTLILRIIMREHKLSEIDPLTEINNLRGFNRHFTAIVRGARMSRRPITIAYFDLDDFKNVNDKFGHKAGDELLKIIAKSITKGIRSVDVVARLGGDEFIFLLYDIDFNESEIRLKKIFRDIEKELSKTPFKTTISAGAATFIEPKDDIDEVLRIVDNLMYSVKNSGKNGLVHKRIPESV